MTHNRRDPDEIITTLYKLIDVNSVIVSSLDKKMVLKSILEQTKLLMECEKSSVLLIDPESERLYFEVVSNDEEMESLKGIRLKRGEGIAGAVWESGEIQIINEAIKDKRFSRKADRKLAASTTTLIAAPLAVRGRTIGVMEAMNKTNGRFFDDFDREVFRTLSHQAAIAIYNAQLYEMAIRDGMTGLYIHHYYYERLAEEFRRALRNKHHLAVIMFDLDFFKKVNDTYGHRLGDEILIKTASVVRRNCRVFDIAARYGGEEFSMILPETDNEGGRVMAERIRQLVARIKVPYGDRKVGVTISAGVASLFENNPATVDRLIEMADRALYYSKETGRNRISVFHEDMGGR